MQEADFIDEAKTMMYLSCIFLQRDSYAKRGICRRRVSVCVCVCVCVCVRHTPVLYQNG